MSKSFNEIGLDKSIQHIGVIMEKFDTKVYPKYELPIGYSFVNYSKGLEKDWVKLQFAVEQVDTLEEAEAIFAKEFAPNKEILNRNMIFVKSDAGEIVATSCIWNGRMFGDDRIRIHWVAVAPEYQGLGISKAMVTKLFDIYNELGYEGYIHLTSQTWSYKALNVYIKFGFKPYFGEKPTNWKAVNLTSGNFEPWDYKEKNKEAWNMIYEKICEYDKRLNI